MILPRKFYNRDTITVAKELLGKYLVHEEEEGITAGMIVETEAYIGIDDPACHATFGKTTRNEPMFGECGFTYIYFIYGMYYCLNIVTEEVGKPCACLIRALEPIAGIEIMKKRRNTTDIKQLTNGPSKLCQALGLSIKHNRMDITKKPLYIKKSNYKPLKIIETTRIGIKKGLDRNWRFYIADNEFVSRK